MQPSSSYSNGYSQHGLSEKRVGMSPKDHRFRRGSRNSKDSRGISNGPRVSGQDTPPYTEFDMAYFQSYSHVGIHEEMIKDRVRTETYRAAISQHRNSIAGKVVVDVGCGTGILSIFCAMAGAKRIVTKQNKTSTLQLQDKNGLGGTVNHGTLTVDAEEAVTSRQAVDITFRCSHLDNKDLFSKSDPFLRISRIIEGGKPIPICKTEVVKDNLNPTWKSVCLNMQQCGSKDTPLVIECLDFNNSGNHELIGELQKSVANLERLHQEKVGERSGSFLCLGLQSIAFMFFWMI